MGQEWGASTPFHFFTDFEGELGANMADYRLEEFERLGFSIAPDGEAKVVDPQSEVAFESSKLRWDELDSEPHRSTFEFYRKAIALRKELHIDGNPARTNWQVWSDGDVVVVSYSYRDTKVEVHFAVKKGDDLRLPPGKILFRSGIEASDQPETVVLEIPR